MAEPNRTNLRRAHRPPRPVAAVVARLPKGADGRPLRARQRLVVAALLLLVGGALLSPALEAARTSFAGSGSTAQAAWSGAAPAVSAPAAPSAIYGIPPAAPPSAYARTTHGQPGTAPTSPAEPAAAAIAVPAAPAAPGAPAAPTVPAVPTVGPGGVSVSVDTGTAGRNQVIQIIILMTVLSIAPSLLLLCTSFTKIAVVLSLTRNALGTPTIPPNQVLAGLALFLSLFVMSPVISQMNDVGVQPYLNNQLNEQQALAKGGEPLRLFMAAHTGDMELQTMIKMSKSEQPRNKADTSFTTLIPAFILSELKSAFIIGFVIFIPFLVIDLVVSSVLMSMGMMMLPPVMISLPFKLLLFVMVDGWSLITTALITSYR